MSVKTLYALIICQNQASFYFRRQHNWFNKPLNLETSNSVNSADDLNQLLQILNKSLNEEDELGSIELVVLYASENIKYLSHLPKQLAELQCASWQILHWESLLQRSVTVSSPKKLHKAHQDEIWLINTLLPLLDNTLHHRDEAWLSERKRAQREHEETLSSLKSDRTDLENQIALLKQQIKSLRSYDLEQLLIFLPIIYRNFWSKIKPSDLALISGNLSIPDIPSPYLEPDAHTLQTMKQRLQKLPQENREQLRDFCSQLPHTLDVRPEMRFFFNE